MKTPYEIKTGLECCTYATCNGCPYAEDGCGTNQGMIDAIAYIQQLERERDAAVEDLETMGKAMANCDTCLHNNTNYNEEPCIRCMSGYLINNWQWRGGQNDE